MSGRFDWQYEEAEETSGQPAIPAVARHFRTLAAAFLLIALILWVSFRLLSDRAERTALTSIQFILDVTRDACRAGDGEVFFSLQSDDPARQALLLEPQQYEAYCTGLTAIDVRPFGGDYVAVLSEPGNGVTRLAFFNVQPGETRQIPPPAGYWGEERTLHRPAWGTLIYGAADEPFAADIAAFIDDRVAALCAGGGCRRAWQPFVMRIRPDHRRTAEPHTLHVPSPLLAGLDTDEQPAPGFWDALDAELTAHLTPGVIRFAVPPLLQQAIIFDNAAAEFMRRNPDITVEIVTLDVLPEEADATLAQYDGAAYAPTAGMIAAGLVRDVTDYMATDPDFDPAGFHGQIWRGAQWRGRLWFVPQAGQMRLLFRDRNAYEALGLVEPTSDWDWAAVERDLAALRVVSPTGIESWSGESALLDMTRDSLFAYAFSRSDCSAPPAQCTELLEPDDIAAALGWYRQRVGEQDMPDLVASPPADRARLMANWQGVPRRAALWVDDAVSYEHYLQMWPVGVVPFPDVTAGAPLWVHGSFISSHSARPLDVWRWLVFLSRQPLNGPLRYVPARPEVAEQTRYWETLPGPLRAALRTSFASARAIPLEQRDLFSREQLEAALGGSPVEAAQQGVELDWFGR